MIDNLKEAISQAREEKEKIEKTLKYWESINAPLSEQIKYEIVQCNDKLIQCSQQIAWLTELQERREADRWNFIHTEADLPKESDYYLVTSEVRQGRKYVCLAFYDASKGKFLKDASISVLGVIAWKPLPKPYESEDK